MNYVRKNESSLLKRILLSTGVVVSVAIIITTIVLIIRSCRRETTPLPHRNGFVSDYSYYATSSWFEPAFAADAFQSVGGNVISRAGTGVLVQLVSDALYVTSC